MQFFSKGILGILSMGSLMLISGIAGPAYAATTPSTASSSVSSSAMETTQQFLAHPPLPSPNAKVIGEEIVASSSPAPTNVANSIIQPQWGYPHYYLTDVQNIGGYCGLNKLGTTYGVGPMTLSLTISKGVNATYSDNAGVSASVISAGVGYSVTSTYTVSSTGTVYVPSGKEYELVAYPTYSQKSYQVWYNPIIGSAHEVGTGTAAKPTGVCFVWYQV